MSNIFDTIFANSVEMNVDWVDVKFTRYVPAGETYFLTDESQNLVEVTADRATRSCYIVGLTVDQTTHLR